MRRVQKRTFISSTALSDARAFSKLRHSLRRFGRVTSVEQTKLNRTSQTKIHPIPSSLLPLLPRDIQYVLQLAFVLQNHVGGLRARTVSKLPISIDWTLRLIANARRQNNDSLSALSAKVSQLRSVTVDIYDNARDHGVIDNTTETFSSMSTSIKGSAKRLGTMASQGNKVAIFKLAGIIIGVVILLYWLLSWIF